MVRLLKSEVKNYPKHRIKRTKRNYYLIEAGGEKKVWPPRAYSTGLFWEAGSGWRCTGDLSERRNDP